MPLCCILLCRTTVDNSFYDSYVEYNSMLPRSFTIEKATLFRYFASTHYKANIIERIKKLQTHLEDYLSFYQSLNSPRYAVLITGEWGVGKTYQVKKCISDKDRYYVSLFGIQTVEQLHAEVYAVASPALSKISNMVGKTSDTVASVGGVFALAGATPSVFNAIIKKDVKPNRILIFDDLERSDLDLKDVLGAINSYVEQQGFRVVVIAHDEKMTGQFLDMKEKIFGQTIRVEPQINDAMNSFMEKVSDPRAKQLIEKQQNAILNVFGSSKVKSLRILRHIVEDIERLVATLSDTHLENANAMVDLIQLFCAFNVEIRMARLDESAFKKRSGVNMSYHIRSNATKDDQLEMPALLVADDRYPTIDLESSLLSDDVLAAIFIEGRYPLDEIRRCLDNSAYFIKPAEVPPWKVVINFDKLDDDIVEVARVRMEQQFTDRSVTDSGEILHIFALKMMMAEHGIDKGSIEDVVVLCKAYVDDLLYVGKLPPRETDWQWHNAFNHSYEGLGYWVSVGAAPHFKELWDHLIAAREEALEKQFPRIFDELLAMIVSDPNQFFESMSPTSKGENPYALIPMLHRLPAERFVNAWLRAPKENWREVSTALENRYSHGQIHSDLSVEKNWVLEVCELLEKRANEADGFKALRIRRMIPKTLRELAAERE